MDTIILIAYLGILIGIGVYHSKKVEDFDDFAVAGRNVVWPILLATTSASMIGGGASMGSVQKAYASGAAIGILASAWYLSLVYSGFCVAPKLRRFETFVTVGDFFEHHFGKFSRIFIAIVAFIFCIGIIAAQIVAMGKILEAMIGLPFVTAALLSAAVVIIYAVLGGMTAVVKIDAIQFIVLIGGFTAAAFIGLQKVGWYENLLAQVPPEFIGITGTIGWPKTISLFIAFFLGELFAPYFVQRMYSAKDPKTALVGVAGSGVFMTLFLPITMVTLGFVALVLIPGIDSTLALPSVIKLLFPGPTAAIITAGMLACMMSSCDATLASCSVIATRDFYLRFTNKKLLPKTQVTIARGTTFVIGCAALLMALIAPNVIDLLLYSYSVWAPVAILPILVGISKKYKPNLTYSVIASMVAGMATSIGWMVTGQPYNLDSGVAGFVVAVAVYFISLPITKNMKLGSMFIPSCTNED